MKIFLFFIITALLGAGEAAAPAADDKPDYVRRVVNVTIDDRKVGGAVIEGSKSPFFGFFYCLARFKPTFSKANNEPGTGVRVSTRKAPMWLARVVKTDTLTDEEKAILAEIKETTTRWSEIMEERSKRVDRLVTLANAIEAAEARVKAANDKGNQNVAEAQSNIRDKLRKEMWEIERAHKLEWENRQIMQKKTYDEVAAAWAKAWAYIDAQPAPEKK